jgi:hypothetical protein
VPRPTSRRSSRAAGPLVAGVAFWAVWDWAFLSMTPSREAVESVKYCLTVLKQIYEREGFPEPTDVGLVPFRAATEVNLI